MQRHLIWLAGLLTLASASALAAPRAAPPPGAVASAWETIVEVRPDGTKVTTSRPIKDIAAWFESMGAPVPPIAPQQSCLPEVIVTPGGGGGGGGGGAGNVPPAQDAATAAALMPPISVTTDPHTTSFTGGMGFDDGWSVLITWNRSPGNPPGEWFQTDQHWTRPGHGNGVGGGAQSICNEEQE